MCDLALEKLADLSFEVHMDEYSHFDALTGVRISVVLPQMSKALTKDAHQISWKTALNTIDARVKSRPDVENELLRHWRGVIERGMPVFKRTLWGTNKTRRLRCFFFRWMVEQGTRLTQIYYYPRNGSLMGSEVMRPHCGTVAGWSWLP